MEEAEESGMHSSDHLKGAAEERALQAPVSEWERVLKPLKRYLMVLVLQQQDPGWLEGALWTPLPGLLPGKSGGRTGKHRLLFPACFSVRSCESPWGNCPQAPPSISKLP